MNRPSIALATALATAACAPTGQARPQSASAPVRYTPLGLERVLGQDAPGLVRLFGQPDAEVREGQARKLQFQSGICVLDAYLYPKGGEAPRVTYLDARQPDGSAIDRASCVAALTRRSAHAP